MSNPRIRFWSATRKWYCKGQGREGSGYTPREAFEKWLNGLIVELWQAREKRACPPNILRSRFAADMRALYGLRR